MPIPKAYQGDSNAPWNQPPAPECSECREIIHDVDSHADDCMHPLPVEEIRKREYEAAQPEYTPEMNL